MAGGLYGAPAPEEEPMDDMPMGSDPAASEFEPKDDEERAYVDFMDEALPMEERVAAIKEAVRLCVEKQSGGEYSGSSGGSSEKKPKDIDLLVFGAPKKKS